MQTLQATSDRTDAVTSPLLRLQCTPRSPTVTIVGRQHAKHAERDIVLADMSVRLSVTL